MQRAIELGQQARYWSAPNPRGLVLVAMIRRLAPVYATRRAAHAEIMALNAAGDATGARPTSHSNPAVIRPDRSLRQCADRRR